MRDRVACERCGAHKDASIHRGACFVCGYQGFQSVTRIPSDIPELHAAMTGLTADLVRLDPSSRHLELARLVATVTAEHVIPPAIPR